ncbi:hypothetical protein ACFSCZ_16960 [Siminovitchia sediminis]|uniref:Uncharacterized protein n=1 Tax=Siminovitchia sediminis TaxID=1274353 RepID=A0ABW4KMR4_9BACI
MNISFVIREWVSGLEKEYVVAPLEWESALSNTHQQVVSFIESVDYAINWHPTYIIVFSCLFYSGLFNCADKLETTVMM